MQQVISKKQFLEKIGQLNPFLQQTVMVFIDSLLETQTTVGQRDKHRLLDLSLWTEEDVCRVEEAQDRINAWQLPAY